MMHMLSEQGYPSGGSILATEFEGN